MTPGLLWEAAIRSVQLSSPRVLTSPPLLIAVCRSRGAPFLASVIRSVVCGYATAAMRTARTTTTIRLFTLHSVDVAPVSSVLEQMPCKLPESCGVDALRVDQYEIENMTPKSPHFTRDFTWIVSAHIGFSVCSSAHMSIASRGAEGSSSRVS